MLCWICDKTIWDKIRNDTFRENVGVTPIVEIMVENKLRWFGHVERISIDSVVKRVDMTERSQTTKGRVRPRKILK